VIADTTLTRALRIGGGLAAASAIGSSLALIIAGRAIEGLSQFLAAFALFAAFFGVFAWVAASRQPRNSVVWVMVISAVSAAWYVTGVTLVLLASTIERSLVVSIEGFPLVAPASLPRAEAWLLFLTEPASLPGFMLPMTLGLFLFPNGRFLSRRWRVLGWAASVTIGVAFLTVAWIWRPWSPVAPQAVPVSDLSFGAFMVLAALGVASLIARARRSSGEARHQLKWILWGGSLFTLALVVGGSLVDTSYRSTMDHPVFQLVWTLAVVAFPASYGVAVAKFRLYDIDVLVSRTFVYGTLAVFITGFYIAVVVGLGGLLGGDSGSNSWLAIGATAVVAMAFEPLRQRLQRLANRLVYGRRATPYEVLSTFSEKVTASDDALLDQIARSLVDGTTATQAAVWLCSNDVFDRAAVWPIDAGANLPETASSSDIPGADVVALVRHEDEVLGALTLGSRGQELLPADERLLVELASALGLALRNIQLRRHLEHQIEQLRDSRQRIVAVQDETRRRLERDLHDGAQQRLVAIKIRLGLAKKTAELNGLAPLQDVLDELGTETDRAIEALRDFARGVHPPLLQAEGLATAITSQVRRLTIPVTVHAPGLRRYSPSIEGAIYFCVMEALQNVVKHAGASSAHVALHHPDDRIVFEVSDDGAGFDTSTNHPGTGLSNLVDRMDALDGHLEVISTPHHGTTVRGAVPVASLETVDA